MTASHNPPLGQRLQMLRPIRRTGHFPPTMPASSPASRRPRIRRNSRSRFAEAAPVRRSSIRWVPRDDVDLAYITAVVSESRSATRATSPSYTTPLHGVGEAVRRPRVPRPRAFAGYTSSPPSARQTAADFPNVPDHIANPARSPRTLEAAIADAKTARGRPGHIASDPDADQVGVAVPTTRDPRAIGLRSTATRSASVLWRPS